MFNLAEGRVAAFEALGMETTAEGVESAGQVDILREQGCSRIPGFYFSESLPEPELVGLFEKEKRDPA